MSFWKRLKFNPEVFVTKTFMGSVVSYAGVWTMFAAGEVDWKFVLGTTVAFMLMTFAKDGAITIEKAIAARDCQDEKAKKD